MAELKTLGRSIGQPSAPDISGAGQVYGNLGKVAEDVATTVGQYVKATRELEESSLLATMTNEFETDFIKYKNDPNINQGTLEAFNQQLDARVQGYSANGGSKEFLASLNSAKNKYANKALDSTLHQGMKNEIRDISLGIHENQNLYVNQIQDGDFGGALETKENLAKLMQALVVRGASAEDIIKVSDSTDAMGIIAEGSQRLKSARSSEERKAIMKEVFDRPDTPVNVKAATALYKQFTKIEKLNKDAEDLSIPWKNAQTGNNFENRELDGKDADKLVAIASKNIASKSEEGPVEPQPVSKYQSMPAYKGQTPTYDYEEELAAEREGRKQNTFLVDSLVQSEEAPPQRDANLFELAQAHAFIGSKNAKEFPKAIRNRLYGGNGEQANDAVTAINYVLRENAASLDLDSETDMLYTEFKIARDSGRTDYENMIKEARDAVLKSKANIEINSAIYNSKFSLASKSGINELNKSFKEATGVDAIKTGSTEALNNFGHILRSKFLIANGRYDTAFEAAKREMSKTHGQDTFTGGKYEAFPPTKMLQGLDETQIGNQILLQVVSHADKSGNITYPERYNRIKEANETDRMNINYISAAKQPSKNVPEKFKAGIQITQNIEGLGNITGTVFLKPNELTDQNNTGMPVWEAWMIDDMGREHPIIDNTSPVRNRLLIIGKSAQEFAPNYTKNLDDQKIQEIANEVLVEEGTKLYRGTSWSPLAIIDDYKNYKSFKAYINDTSNKERVEKKVKKVLGKENE